LAKEYLERLAAQVRRAIPESSRSAKLECKHFFSGAALYANGKICASLTPVGFAIKLPERSRTALLRQHRARPLRYFANAPVKREYVVLGQSLVGNAVQLGRWLKVSMRYVAGVQDSRR